MRTCTTMVMTDGTTSYYEVLRGPMRGKAFNAAKAETIATYKVVGLPDYKGMTAAHATANAPAVYWQA